MGKGMGIDYGSGGQATWGGREDNRTTEIA